MKKNRFRTGDSVYDGRRPSCNGTIIKIDWEDREIYVSFYKDPDVVVYDFDEFEYNWTDKFGGMWFLHDLTERTGL